MGKLSQTSTNAIPSPDRSTIACTSTCLGVFGRPVAFYRCGSRAELHAEKDVVPVHLGFTFLGVVERRAMRDVHETNLVDVRRLRLSNLHAVAKVDKVLVCSLLLLGDEAVPVSSASAHSVLAAEVLNTHPLTPMVKSLLR
jgi:hypothetical protein